MEMESERLNEVRELAEEYAAICKRDSRDDRPRRKAICQMCRDFDPVETAYFCQTLASNAPDHHRACGWLTVFANRLTDDLAEGFVQGEVLLLKGGVYYAIMTPPSNYAVYAAMQVDQVNTGGFILNGSRRVCFIKAEDVVRRTFLLVALPEDETRPWTTYWSHH